jgi:hypothetical protein
MSRIQNLDHLDQRFVRFTRGDIPVGLRSKESIGGIRNELGDQNWLDNDLGRRFIFLKILRA